MVHIWGPQIGFLIILVSAICMSIADRDWGYIKYAGIFVGIGASAGVIMRVLNV